MSAASAYGMCSSVKGYRSCSADAGLYIARLNLSGGGQASNTLRQLQAVTLSWVSGSHHQIHAAESRGRSVRSA